jgi:Polyketide cyclase / dehydrase and lipid transport
VWSVDTLSLSTASGRATIKKVTQHSESRVVPYTADALFQVVADIERYPEFLPWVVALRVLSRQEQALIAEMAVGYSGSATPAASASIRPRAPSMLSRSRVPSANSKIIGALPPLMRAVALISQFNLNSRVRCCRPPPARLSKKWF